MFSSDTHPEVSSAGRHGAVTRPAVAVPAGSRVGLFAGAVGGLDQRRFAGGFPAFRLHVFVPAVVVRSRDRVRDFADVPVGRVAAAAVGHERVPLDLVFIRFVEALFVFTFSRFDATVAVVFGRRGRLPPSLDRNTEAKR